MNLPNKLTLLRIILIPVFMVVLYWGFPGATWVALAIFIIASLTDMLDGTASSVSTPRILDALAPTTMWVTSNIFPALSSKQI